MNNITSKKTLYDNIFEVKPALETILFGIAVSEIVFHPKFKNEKQHKELKEKSNQ